MKRTAHLILLAVLGLTFFLPTIRAVADNAKPPTQMTYQGFLTDANGVPFGNSAPVNKTVIFRIFDSLTGGTIKWSSQQVVTVDKGYFSVLLGQGSTVNNEPFTPDLSTVFTGAGASDRFLELTADTVTIAPRLRFYPAPSAMLAKSATELLDPITGVNALSVSGGNLTATGSITAGSLTGNGASLTNINASQITSGTLVNARTTATSLNTANAIMARDGSGNVSVGALSSSTVSSSGLVYGGSFYTGGNVTNHSQGAYLEWNKDGGGGSTYLLNQKGLGGGGIVFGEVDSANVITERMRIDGSGNLTAKGVTVDSLKITGTSTYLMTSLSRASLLNAAPMTGVTQTRPSDGVTNNGRQNANSNADWWKSTQTAWGTLLYTGTFVVPVGETWEVEYTCNFYWGTDDSGAITWSLNDTTLPDDAVTTAYNLSGGSQMFNQTFILTAGTQVIRVKGIIGSGSGSDTIYFPWHTPSHFVLKKYKTN